MSNLFEDLKYKVNIEEIKIKKNTSKFLFSKLPRGYGLTYGNSFRRILLSSIKGTSVVAINLNNRPSLYHNIDGVYDRNIKIISNIKKIVFKNTGSKLREIVSLKLIGPRVVIASDFNLENTQLEIINKDEYITEIVSKKEIEITLILEQNINFVGIDEDRMDLLKDYPKNFIKLNVFFSPIIKVSYNVIELVSKDILYFETLELIIITNGSISAKKALIETLEIMKYLEFQFLQQFVPSGKKEDTTVIVPKKENVFLEINDIKVHFNNVLLEDLNFSTRLLNCLHKEKIFKVSDLQKYTILEIEQIKNLGNKTLQELTTSLIKYKIKLKLEE